MTINTIVADDEILIRNLYVSSLKKYDDIKVVGEAGNGEEVMKLLRQIQPDVLMLDLNMPKGSGIEVLNMINAACMRVNTLVISMHDSDALIWEAINLGALGFLAKSDEWEELYTAIKTVAKGKFYNTDRVHSILLDIARKQKKEESNPQPKKFTEREQSIINYLHKGQNSAEIADRVYCSRANVDRIRQDLIHRVGVRNTAELIVYAIKHKIIGLDDNP